MYITLKSSPVGYAHCFICNNYIDLSSKVEKSEKIYNLIQGCDLQKHGIVNTDIDSRMSPEESKLLLVDLLKIYDSEITPDQIPRLSGLVCGFVKDTGHHIWAAHDEFVALGGKVTLRSGSLGNLQS